MISDVLKDREPASKPRFFLHDEMKAWLTENLKIEINTVKKFASDPNLQTVLNVPFLSIGQVVNIGVKVDDELIVQQSIDVHMDGYERSLKTITNVVSQCMSRIVYLEEKNNELQRRIDLLENPLPV